MDPDARMSVRPGKARKLNYTCGPTVDTSHHVVSDIGAYRADGKDNQHLQDMVGRTKARLWRQGLVWEDVLADTGHSSGENHAFPGQQGVCGHIPPHRTYKGGPDGFTHVKGRDHYICPRGETIPFKGVFPDHRTRTKKEEYRGSGLRCKGCPMAGSCPGRTAKERKFSVAHCGDRCERNNSRMQSPKGKGMKAKRQSTVGPVLGVLAQSPGMRKVNVRGLAGANKCMHLAATAYNLKRLLKYTTRRAKGGMGALLCDLHLSCGPLGRYRAAPTVRTILA